MTNISTILYDIKENKYIHLFSIYSSKSLELATDNIITRPSKVSFIDIYSLPKERF